MGIIFPDKLAFGAKILIVLILILFSPILLMGNTPVHCHMAYVETKVYIICLFRQSNLERVHRNKSRFQVTKTCCYSELVSSGKWDDVLLYHFRYNTCGQLFELSAETYHGAGGW
jgi:hypothetical protein